MKKLAFFSVIFFGVVVGCTTAPQTFYYDFDMMLLQEPAGSAEKAAEFVAKTLHNHLFLDIDTNTVLFMSAVQTSSMAKTKIAIPNPNVKAFGFMYAPANLGSGKLRYVYVAIQTDSSGGNEVFTVQNAYAFEGNLSVVSTDLTTADVVYANSSGALAPVTDLGDYLKRGNFEMTGGIAWDQNSRVLSPQSQEHRIFIVNPTPTELGLHAATIEDDNGQEKISVLDSTLTGDNAVIVTRP